MFLDGLMIFLLKLKLLIRLICFIKLIKIIVMLILIKN